MSDEDFWDEVGTDVVESSSGCSIKKCPMKRKLLFITDNFDELNDLLRSSGHQRWLSYEATWCDVCLRWAGQDLT